MCHDWSVFGMDTFTGHQSYQNNVAPANVLPSSAVTAFSLVPVFDGLWNINLICSGREKRLARYTAGCHVRPSLQHADRDTACCCMSHYTATILPNPVVVLCLLTSWVWRVVHVFNTMQLAYHCQHRSTMVDCWHHVSSANYCTVLCADCIFAVAGHEQNKRDVVRADSLGCAMVSCAKTVLMQGQKRWLCGDSHGFSG
ncbi:hypothetical protein VFPPC_17763 [Pochonia chlamydosporia 170]|uniref:Uncharacterized protein n=1 Tax=Pochonia chlamydosporia 170 TaxID=1380566 RepID=A0A219AQN2_METCM|nr:hypothetical protein VFPPC_17763 [Pochonia chlamydosporia 170]OWT43061.1 hypothetical protein VFPPC_17763 [Pochonia chlamydosporia 170]